MMFERTRERDWSDPLAWAFIRAIFVAKSASYLARWAGASHATEYGIGAALVIGATAGLFVAHRHLSEPDAPGPRLLGLVHLVSLLMVGGGLWILVGSDAALAYLVFTTTVVFIVSGLIARRSTTRPA